MSKRRLRDQPAAAQLAHADARLAFLLDPARSDYFDAHHFEIDRLLRAQQRCRARIKFLKMAVELERLQEKRK